MPIVNPVTRAASYETCYAPPVRPHIALTLASLQRGSGDPTQRQDRDGSWWRTMRTPAGPATLRLLETPAGVRATAWGDGAQWALAQVPTLLGGADDVTGFEPRHTVVRETWRRLSHLRLPQVGLVFECLVPAVLEQRVTGHEARASWRTLVRRFGEPAPGPAPSGLRVVPPPPVWRRIPSWEWHRANVDPGRARTVIAAAEVAHRLEESLSLPRDVRLQRLRAVPGVGVWTAAEVAQRAWGDPDEVSVGDFHLPALVGWALAGRPVDDDGMLELLEPYRGHRHRAVRLVELSGVRKPGFGPRMTYGDIRAI
jgi:3-methyladenine DNA glycosylase/8-oxoguanine DNA glycosylase